MSEGEVRRRREGLHYKDVKGTNRLRGQIGCDSAVVDGWERRIMVEEGDKIRQWGDIVAVVVADNEKHARAAAQKIKVDYEQLPELVDVREAIKADAVSVFDDCPGIDGMPNAWNKRASQRAMIRAILSRTRRIKLTMNSTARASPTWFSRPTADMRITTTKGA
ncbi:MAG: hypothetical protein ACLUEQ_04105 [Cloacibacillus evryensis]